MAIVNKVDQKAKVDIDTTIQYQIVTYCFFNDVQISNADLRCLAELAKQGEVELTLFCNDVTDMGIFKSPQMILFAGIEVRISLVVRYIFSRKTKHDFRIFPGAKSIPLYNGQGIFISS